MAPARTPTERGRATPRRLPLLLGLAAVLGGVLAWERWEGWSGAAVPERAGAPELRAEPPSLASGDAAAAPAAHWLASLTLGDLRDTARRPLFEKKRRPIEAPQAPAMPSVPTAKPQADPAALTLQGVVLSEGSTAVALMRRTQTGQSVRLQEGDTVDGWTIERIEADRVLLLHGDTRLALQLFRKR